jgi:hypothetical protein
VIGPYLVGRIEFARFGGKPERRTTARGIGPQMQGMAVEKGRVLHEVLSGVMEGKSEGPEAEWVRAKAGHARIAACRRGQQIGKRDSPSVFIGTIGMQAIAATAGGDVDQRQADHWRR